MIYVAIPTPYAIPFVTSIARADICAENSRTLQGFTDFLDLEYKIQESMIS